MSRLDACPDIPHSAFRIPHSAMSHLLALGLLGVDCLVRAWRIQLAVWTAGGRLSFNDAFRLNLYGEAASQLTPNRLGGEPARFLGLHEAGLRPVTAIVAIGVEVACEWPVFVLAAGAMVAYYVPDWRDAARVWLRHHRAGELVTLEITVLLILVTVYLLQRLARSGFVSHRVRRQWRVAWAHVRRAPRWALGAGALLTVVSLAARALILPALAWGLPDGPPFGQMFFGALALKNIWPNGGPSGRPQASAGRIRARAARLTTVKSAPAPSAHRGARRTCAHATRHWRRTRWLTKPERARRCRRYTVTRMSSTVISSVTSSPAR